MARISSAGHGGQIILSESTHQLICDSLPPGIKLTSLGKRRHRFLESIRSFANQKLEEKGEKREYMTRLVDYLLPLARTIQIEVLELIQDDYHFSLPKSNILSNLSFTELCLGKYHEAIKYAEESILLYAGSVLTSLELFSESAMVLGAIEEKKSLIFSNLPAYDKEISEQITVSAKTALGEDLFNSTFAAGKEMGVDKVKEKTLEALEKIGIGKKRTSKRGSLG